jgi:hypothetical protein
MFLGYIKALAAVGVKMLMLCLCLGAVRNIMSTWPGMIATQLENADSVFSFLMPMSCALIGFYMLVKAVPQFASSVMTGSVSGMDGGMVKSAAMAGAALGMTVINTSRMAAQKMIGGASLVSQAAQAYQYTAQASKDTGSTPGEARKAGASEAFKTIMTGPQAGGPRAAGERIYSDFQRNAQFADVRGGSANTVSAPPNSTTSAPDISTTPGDSKSNPSGSVHGAGAYTTPSSQNSGQPVNSTQPAGNVTIAGSAKEAKDIYGSPDDSWGIFESDRKKKG